MGGMGRSPRICERHVVPGVACNPRRAGRGTAHLLLVVISAPIMVSGCRREEPPQPAPALDVRPVRVALVDGSGACRLRIDGGYVLRDASGEVHAQGDELSWTELAVQEELVFGESALGRGPLVLEPTDAGVVRVRTRELGGAQVERSYPGALELSVRVDGGLRVVNHVDLEGYVAGVVAQESWPTFHDEALKAQAIAARTYAMYLMGEREQRPFDLRAGEGDQVYRGLRIDDFGRRVAEAVEATRGLVLATATPDGPRIFCTYYAAACGGRSQSITDMQGTPSVGPLVGGVPCDYCEIAKGQAYRWGPVRVDKVELLGRIRQRDAAFADWAAIASVAVSRQTAFGRIAEVTLTAGDGRQRVVRGEWFRLAVGSRSMRSTDCTLLDEGATLLLENGKGFGHGVGMCQWGAEGQARAGRRGGEILLYYYPGANIVRAY